ncbi:MAG: MBL fold metallo-hydrolase [Leptospiraceae bacterium]|nr:MBL fold metallo-hydrolase [Leptospiraceae bacterium]
MRARETSPQWNKDRFTNTLPTITSPGLSTVVEFFLRGEHRTPAHKIPTIPRQAQEFSTAARDLTVTWFGHSSAFVEADGFRVLLDPVWGERASPVSFAGPRRFFAPPLPLSDLLSVPIDAVIISHNHYDHLDAKTIRALSSRDDLLFITPLGVGDYLTEFGIREENIVELDWWEKAHIGAGNGLEITATPARHFSGRAIAGVDRDRSLWAGWSLNFKKGDRRVFFSGDTAMFPGFREIGERLGPFDLTMIEVGAYNAAWTDSHIGPEQAIQAHRDLRGALFLPVHWGTFELAMHSWIEPVERLVVAAEKAQVELVIPRPGQSVLVQAPPPVERWWPDIPWQTAREAPIVSSGLENREYASADR